MAVSSGSFSSKTAVLVAAYRALSTQSAKPVCRDVWAAKLIGEEGFELAARYNRVYPHGELYTAVRAAFIDGEVAAAIARGIDQIVLLGAGLDTRAARLGRAGVRFFEVDHPASQEDKLARLRKVEDYPVGAATFVSCDFESQDFVVELARAGFDRGRAAYFVWEGVAMYLTEPAVRATLRRVSSGCAPDSWIIFDLLGKKLVEGRSKQPEDHEMRALLDEMGEPLIFGINDAVELLYEEGFRHVRTVSFDEACLSLTGTYDRARGFRFPKIATASVTPPAR